MKFHTQGDWIGFEVEETDSPEIIECLETMTSAAKEGDMATHYEAIRKLLMLGEEEGFIDYLRMSGKAAKISIN